jgi:spore coat protein JC
MWNYEKRLQFPVKISKPDPKAAQIIITQFGGPDGELAASMRYLSQRYTMPYKEVTGILTDIGTEESVPNPSFLFLSFFVYFRLNMSLFCFSIFLYYNMALWVFLRCKRKEKHGKPVTADSQARNQRDIPGISLSLQSSPSGPLRRRLSAFHHKENVSGYRSLLWHPGQ